MLRHSSRGKRNYLESKLNADENPLTETVQIGLQHGSEAKQQIFRCIDFYADLFQKSAKKNWHEVRELAVTFEPTIRKNWPAYLEEMEGK